MEALKSKTVEMLSAMKLEFENKEKALKDDDRDDEALIEKIKGNIAEIFLTVFVSSYNQTKAKGGEKEELIDTFSIFFDKIPATWRASLQDAKADDDFETIYKEKAKISTAEKIQKQFNKLAGECDV